VPQQKRHGGEEKAPSIRAFLSPIILRLPAARSSSRIRRTKCQTRMTLPGPEGRVRYIAHGDTRDAHGESDQTASALARARLPIIRPAQNDLLALVLAVSGNWRSYDSLVGDVGHIEPTEDGPFRVVRRHLAIDSAAWRTYKTVIGRARHARLKSGTQE
jgi:hypothetical protein